MRPPVAELGFVGLGTMGGRMAKRLIEAGHTVTGHNRTRSKADWLVAEGLRWADTPREVAEAADVTLSMVTHTDALARARPVLEDIGPKVSHVGGNGQAVLMKIASNLSLAVQMTAFSEGVLLAERGGIAREKAVEVLLNSVIASPMVRYRGPFVLEMPDEAWFDVNMMQKDMLLALESGREFDVPLPTTAVVNELLTSARAMGLDKEDFAVLFRVLAHLSGVDQ